MLLPCRSAHVWTGLAGLGLLSFQGMISLFFEDKSMRDMVGGRGLGPELVLLSGRCAVYGSMHMLRNCCACSTMHSQSCALLPAFLPVGYTHTVT
jgi:hypothetical protein